MRICSAALRVARKAVRVLADEGTVFVVPQRMAFVSAPEQTNEEA